jgi:predicted TIM-barrel fold metal-dependent hydrolase
MNVHNDRSYFASHPDHHMYLHPERPSQEALLEARDRVLRAYPKLRFLGAHLASLEWDLDRLGAWLDEFPGAVVDTAARMPNLHVQEPDRVRAFMTRYQDRVLYGSDQTVAPGDPDGVRRRAIRTWQTDWRYLATDEPIPVRDLGREVPGLALEPSIVARIFHDNAVRWFPELRRDGGIAAGGHDAR